MGQNWIDPELSSETKPRSSYFVTTLWILLGRIISASQLNHSYYVARNGGSLPLDQFVDKTLLPGLFLDRGKSSVCTVFNSHYPKSHLGHSQVSDIVDVNAKII